MKRLASKVPSLVVLLGGATLTACIAFSHLLEDASTSDLGVASPEISPPQVTSSNFPTSPLSTVAPAAVAQSIRLCPEVAVVPMRDLGLPLETRLVVTLPQSDYSGVDRAGPFLLSSQDLEPKPVEALIPEKGTSNESYQVSRDGHWLTFMRRQETTQRRELWMSSIDGERLWRIGEVGWYSYARWVNDEEIVIIGPVAWDDSNERPPVTAYMPLLTINPFTLTHEPLPALPETEGERHFADLIRADGRLYALYEIWSQRGFSFYVFDYADETARQVFRWLDSTEWDLYKSLNIMVTAGGAFVLSVDRPYGIDIAFDLALSSAVSQDNYDGNMRPITLPEGILPAYVWSISPFTETIALREELPGDDLSQDLGFYVLDYGKMTLTDYCLRQDISTELDLSPDGRFAALTLIDLPSSLPPRTSLVILSLETGHMAEVDGYRMAGWGRQ